MTPVRSIKNQYLGINAHFFGDGDGKGGDALAVAVGVGVLGLNGGDKSAHTGIEERFHILVDACAFDGKSRLPSNGGQQFKLMLGEALLG